MWVLETELRFSGRASNSLSQPPLQLSTPALFYLETGSHCVAMAGTTIPGVEGIALAQADLKLTSFLSQLDITGVYLHAWLTLSLQ